MLRFFRKMRQALVPENRFEKHIWCLHAFSESIDNLVAIAKDVNGEIGSEKTRLKL